MEFTHYYGKHRRKNRVVVQPVVVQSKVFQNRIGGELRTRIENKVKETGKTFSELDKLLWRDYFRKLDDVAWQKEVEGWK